MIFMVIFSFITIVLLVLSIRLECDESYIALSTILCAVVIFLTIFFKVNAKKDMAIMRSHLENPTYYTYSQLAEHNEHVAELKFWQGTIFSFYNGEDLQAIDIDSVSNKVVVEPKMKK